MHRGLRSVGPDWGRRLVLDDDAFVARGRAHHFGQQQSLRVFLQATALGYISGLSTDGRLDGKRDKPGIPISGRLRQPANDPLLSFEPPPAMSDVQRLLLLMEARRTTGHRLIAVIQSAKTVASPMTAFR